MSRPRPKPRPRPILEPTRYPGNELLFAPLPPPLPLPLPGLFVPDKRSRFFNLYNSQPKSSSGSGISSISYWIFISSNETCLVYCLEGISGVGWLLVNSTNR